MRITLVTETFYPAVDGTTTTVKAVADRLIDTGHEVSVVAPGPGLGIYRRSRVVRIRGSTAPPPGLREALAGFAPDLVHVTSPGAVGRKALKAARRLGVPTVVVEQSPVLDLTADYWRSKVADRADALLVTAPWMVERARDLGATAGLWTPGVDTAAFTPQLRDPWLHASWSRARSRSGPDVVVGYVGSLAARHGVRRLAELARCRGSGRWSSATGRARLAASRLPKAKFTGELETGDLTVALASLDLLVHPGEHETCCHALREAAASGVPVVAPRSGGAPRRGPQPRDRPALRPGGPARPAAGRGRRGGGPAPGPARGPRVGSSRWSGTGAPRSTSWWAATTGRWSVAITVTRRRPERTAR